MKLMYFGLIFYLHLSYCSGLTLKYFGFTKKLKRSHRIDISIDIFKPLVISHRNPTRDVHARRECLPTANIQNGYFSGLKRQ